VKVKNAMSAYDFHTFGSKLGITASEKERVEAIANRLRQFAQDIVDAKLLVYTIEVGSRLAPDEIIQTELIITFTELAE
jgi:hypothetical protein